ncbi:MAG TPA: hypothetical protein VGK72_06935 [Chthoniobacterales bacterium]
MKRTAAGVIEVAILSALILCTRGANHQDVFVGGRIYFLDSDCYARMERAAIVAAHPGAVVRRHEFENYPAGTRPHTTAPLDYLIVALAATLALFTAQPLDLAGAIIAPLLALAGGWFLWWWARQMPAVARYGALLTYALSAILAHGTALGRPDQQALLIILLMIALAAEWRLQQDTNAPAAHVNPAPLGEYECAASGEKDSRVGWSIVSGAAWGLALWVSLYEPLILLAALLVGTAMTSRAQLVAGSRRIGWLIFLAIILVAGLIEWRWPEPPGWQPFFANWSTTIGELRSVSLTSPIWLAWVGALLIISPVSIAFAVKHRRMPLVFAGLVVLCLLLTTWEARWGYFFAIVFLLTIPAQLAIVRQKWLAVSLLALSLLPLLQFWDGRIWPGEEAILRRATGRREAMEWRAAATSLGGRAWGAVLAPWWLAPATAYWSGRPVVGGSSHESLPGIVDTARFFLATSAAEARQILERHGVQWVLVADGERVGENSAAILGRPVPSDALCRILDRTPSQAPSFLVLRKQNDACKTYEFRDFR